MTQARLYNTEDVRAALEFARDESGSQEVKDLLSEQNLDALDFGLEKTIQAKDESKNFEADVYDSDGMRVKGLSSAGWYGGSCLVGDVPRSFHNSVLVPAGNLVAQGEYELSYVLSGLTLGMTQPLFFPHFYGENCNQQSQDLAYLVLATLTGQTDEFFRDQELESAALLAHQYLTQNDQDEKESGQSVAVNAPAEEFQCLVSDSP